jgi:mono/diheme cytochrome c family protein
MAIEEMAMTFTDTIRYPTAALLAALMLTPPAQAAGAAEQQAAYTAQAGTAARPERGQALFTARHGREWSCASCHGTAAGPRRQPRRHRQADRTAGTGLQPGALRRSGQDRKVVPSQLQRRDGPRVHGPLRGLGIELHVPPAHLRAD